MTSVSVKTTRPDESDSKHPQDNSESCVAILEDSTAQPQNLHKTKKGSRESYIMTLNLYFGKIQRKRKGDSVEKEIPKRLF